jgi:excisionase family DNA binding protein
MSVDALQLSLLELDESPKEKPPALAQHRTRKETTAGGTPPELHRPPSPTATSSAQEKETLLTTEEAATLLRVHPRTVQRLVARGQLAAIHLGSAVRFDPRDLGNLIADHKQCRSGTGATTSSRLRATRGGRISFADRLRSEAHEHRAAHA